jgi:cytidylate kinase
MAARALVVAIDGPSGAGKGTVSRAIAARLAYRHIDTGAMYRAVAWRARQLGLDLTNGATVSALAESAALDVVGRVVIDGHDVTEAIRTPEIDQAAAVVAQQPAVRAVLVARQRAYGEQGGVVMEGRDIGSVVFPSADLKIYLDASPEERAKRRAQDLAHAAGRESGMQRVAEALAARDQTDRTRQASPLTLAGDAVYIDTTGVPIELVVQRVLALVEDRLAAPSSAG